MEMEQRPIRWWQMVAAVCLILVGSFGFFYWQSTVNSSFLGDNGAIDGSQRAEAVTTAMNAFVERNHDDYFAYFTAEEYDDVISKLSGTYGGIGIYVTTRPEDKAVMLMMPFRHSPAERAGLQYGDIVVGVDGEDVRGKDLDYVTGKMKGEIGTKVRIEIQRDGKVLPIKTLTREEVSAQAVTGKRLEKENANLGYISISSFNMNISEEFQTVYEDLLAEKEDGDLDGIIIDLRYNPGGVLDGALWLLDYFLPKEDTLLLMNDNTGKKRYVGDMEGIDIPIVILQNDGSASASEVFIGTMQDYHRADTVGTNSYGKGIAQYVIGLPSGAGVRYTYAQYFTAQGREVHKKGLAADYEVPWPENLPLSDSLSGLVEKDPQLAKAVEVLQAKIVAAEQEEAA
ncbi:MAG: PDZ domain-containing protein [Peptococcaceae bacterium]|nr:PDZ domain-containing protein [Peptococcaceae bacterium]